jgi:hypothetical protein
MNIDLGALFGWLKEIVSGEVQVIGRSMHQPLFQDRAWRE